ncbi:MAG: ATP-binding protein [Desulfomonilia bacterium]
MPKLNIFIKIYLWFWIATTLIVGTLISFDRLTQSGPMIHHLQNTIGVTLSLYGQMAAEYHLHGDHAALAKLTDQLKSSSRIDAYVLDDNNQEITNRTLPPDAKALLGQARQSGKTESLFLEDRVLLAMTVTTTNGRLFGVVGIMPRHAFNPFHGNTTLLVFRIFIILFLSGGVCYWLARYLTSPLIKLREATQRFAAGELSVRIGKDTARRRDELTELAKDFDRMAERIESLMTSQRQLLGDISHELRSPLARLNVALELARRQTGPEAENHLNRIEREARLLNEMIGQVLTLTRIENDIEGIQSSPVDLKRLVQKITVDANFEAQDSCHIILHVDSLEYIISGNEELLRRAIENVVRNAIYYTHENTDVNIMLRRVMYGTIPYGEITVHDHGDGVSELELPHLFHPFYRVSDARDRKTGGSGLGLAITERAVRLHHGNVSASNAADGGLVIVIALPLCGDH